MSNRGPIIGYAAELQVAADLMLKGYQVYIAAISNARYDLVISKTGNELKTVEVKASPGGKIYPSMRIRNPDILALVLPSGKVQYTGLEPDPQN